MFARLSTLIQTGHFGAEPSGPFVCQVCGPLSPDERETHRSIYVKGDWEGFPPPLQGRLPATNTYLVNPAHPDNPGAALRFHPERAAELRTDTFGLAALLSTLLPLALAMALAWLLLLFLAGCVATGTKVTEEQLGAFQRGRTTYYDVVASLGRPTASTLHHDGTRQAVYVYSQSQLKAINFVPIAAMFAQGASSETTTVTLEFDARNVLLSYAASQGQTTVGSGFQSGGKQ